MSEPTVTGHCLCGGVSFEITPPISACVTCHCESCRRQCSAPMTAYIGVADRQWRWTSASPKVFRSSPGVERRFCANCGTPLSFRSDQLSGVMHFYVASLENAETFQPNVHLAIEERLAWLKLGDSLATWVGPNYKRV